MVPSTRENEGGTGRSQEEVFRCPPWDVVVRLTEDDFSDTTENDVPPYPLGEVTGGDHTRGPRRG